MASFSLHETSMCDQLKRACLRESQLFSELTGSYLDSSFFSDDSKCFQPVCAWTIGWSKNYPRRVTGTAVCWRSLIRGYASGTDDTSTPLAGNPASITDNSFLTAQGSSRATSSLSNSKISIANTSVTLLSTCATEGTNQTSSIDPAFSISTPLPPNTASSSTDLLSAPSPLSSIDERLLKSDTVLSYINFKPRQQISNTAVEGHTSYTATNDHDIASPAVLGSNQLTGTVSFHNVADGSLLKTKSNNETSNDIVQSKVAPPDVLVLSTQSINDTVGFELSDHVLQALTECLLMHISQQAELLLASGRTRPLNGLLATIEVVIIELEATDRIHHCCDAASALLQRLLNQNYSVHSEHIGKYLCVDPISQDWSHGRVPEDDTCSPSVRYWWVYVQGVFFDLRDNVSVSLACKVLTGVLELSLGRLALTYCSVRLESSDRQCLFFMDVVAVLLAVYDLQRVIVGCTDCSFDTQTDQSLFTLNNQCRSLSLVLAYLLAPLNTISQHISSTNVSSSVDKHSVHTSIWLSRYCTSSMSTEAVQDAQAQANVSIFQNVRFSTAHFPSLRSWAPLVQALSESDSYLAALLIKDLSTQQPKHSTVSNKNIKVRHVLNNDSAACGLVTCCGPSQCGAQIDVCQKDALSALLLIMLRCSRSDDTLIRLLQPCLQQQDQPTLSQQLWTRTRRSVWLHALVDLVIPTAAGAVTSLVDDIAGAVPDVTKFDSQVSMHTLVDYMVDLVTELPNPLLKLFSHFERLFSSQLKFGLGVHVLLCALYDTLNSERFVGEQCNLAFEGMREASPHATTSQVLDATAAVGEQLCSCSLQQNHQSSICERLRESLTAATASITTQSGLSSKTTSSTQWSLAIQLVARDDLGRRALWTVGALLRHNIGWLYQRLNLQNPLMKSTAMDRGQRCNVDQNLASPNELCTDIANVLEQRVFWPQAAAVQLGVDPDCKLDGGHILASCSLPWAKLLLLLPKPEDSAAMRVWYSVIFQLLMARPEFNGTNTLEHPETNIFQMLSDKLKLS